MNQTNEIDISSHSKQNFNGNYNFYFRVLKNGALGGALMGAYLILLQLSSTDHTIWLKFAKYTFLAFVIAMSLKNAKNYFPPLSFFKNGMLIGGGISVIAALILMVLNIFLFAIDPELSFNKFNLEAHNIGELAVLDIAISFEVFVYGMIITFICLQFLKYQDPKGERIL